MVPFKIGNWKITDDGIEWDGEGDYFIDKERLLEVGPGERQKMYDWLVHLTEKSWLTREDIYALNTAFIYALEYFKLPFNSISFVTTLRDQERLMNDREKE